MGVSGQRHALAALYLRGKDPRYPSYRRLEEKSNLDGQVVQSVAGHYTDWATRIK
jgi:hypothetical protein